MHGLRRVFRRVEVNDPKCAGLGGTKGGSECQHEQKSGETVHDHWVFGLDGASQESANVYRIGTNFDNVLEAMKLGASLGFTITWQYILFQHNEHELEKAREIARVHKINFALVYSNRWPKDHQGIFKSQLQNKTFTIHSVDKIYEYTKHK